MKKLTLLFIAALTAFTISAEELDYPTTVINGKTYYIYKVQKSEGYYAISKRFNVTIKEIVDANGDGGLKLGQTVYVPVNEESESPNHQINESTNQRITKSPNHQATGSTVHIVQKGETLYSLSKRYGVTVDEIRALNPESDILSVGESLTIPSKATAQTQTTLADAKTTTTIAAAAEIVAGSVKSVAENTDSVTVTYDIIDEPDEQFEKEPQNSVRIAILMPFNMAAHSESDDKFIDFYRGCLIAADSLKASGYNVIIDSYDIGKTKESLFGALNKKELKEADLIIGPAYTAQIEYVADFAAKNRIKTIIPFSNNVPQAKGNKYLFQIVCPQQELYATVIDKCLDEWQDKKVLIITPDSAGIRFDKKDFSDMLARELRSKNRYCKYISAERVAAEINFITSTDSSEYVLVIPTTNHVKLTQISDRFDAIKSNRVSIFGFPEWNDMLHKDLYGKPLYTFSNYWLNFNDAETLKFFRKYNMLFGVPYPQNNPSYSIFGFDITMFFGKAWCENGKHFEQFFDRDGSQMLQMNFNFEKINGGGYANHGIYLQTFDKEGIH